MHSWKYITIEELFQEMEKTVVEDLPDDNIYHDADDIDAVNTWKSAKKDKGELISKAHRLSVSLINQQCVVASIWSKTSNVC